MTYWVFKGLNKQVIKSTDCIFLFNFNFEKIKIMRIEKIDIFPLMDRLKINLNIDKNLKNDKKKEKDGNINNNESIQNINIWSIENQL